MAAPTLAAFTERAGDLAFIYWGGTSTSGTLLGQVLDFSYTTTKGKTETYRLGDSARYTNYNSVASDWKLTLAEDETFKDVGVIFGKARPTSGWTGDRLPHRLQPGRDIAGAAGQQQYAMFQGGAYGGFCSFDMDSGVYSFLSYRDPNLRQTLENYDRTGDFLRNLELSDAELVKSIIGSIGSIDGYQLPDAKGFTSLQRHLIGRTDAARQQYRDEVLSTTAVDFR